MLARSMPSKRAASRDFYTPYSMFSSDEKWVLMHTAAAGGEKRSAGTFTPGFFNLGTSNPNFFHLGKLCTLES